MRGIVFAHNPIVSYKEKEFCDCSFKKIIIIIIAIITRLNLSQLFLLYIFLYKLIYRNVYFYFLYQSFCSAGNTE